MQNEYRFLPLVISLIAGLVVSVRYILNRNTSINSVVITLSVLLGFYIVGMVIRGLLIHFRTPEEESEDGDKSEEEIPDVSTSSEDDVQE